MMFYVSVIVPMKIEKILTYHCERKTDVGTLVVVEVLKKNYVGIVESITEEKPNFNTKPVVKILKENCYSEAFIKTIKWMSEYYFCPLGLVFKNFFPTFLNPDYLPQSNFSNENTKYITSNYTENINLLIDQIKKKNTVLFFSSERFITYKYFITRILSKGGTVVILIPNDDYIYKILPLLQIFLKNTLVFTAEDSKKNKMAIWESIAKNNGPFLVIGTKNILSLPFKKIDLLIIEEEQDDLYNQEKNLPHYNARNVFLYFAQCLKTKIILGTSSPSIATFYNVQKKKYGYVKIENTIEKKIEISLCKIHMDQIFTRRSFHEMQRYIDSGLQVLILQNKLGYYDNLTCKQCGFCYRCKNCSVSLTFHKQDNVFKCHYCGKTYENITFCNCCGGAEWNKTEMGVEKIYEYLKEIFPNKKIIQINAENIRRKKDREKVLNDIVDANVIVGTKAIESFNFDNVALLILPDFDRLLTNSDFFTNEKIYQMIMRLRKIPNEKIIIQTSIPEHTIFKNLNSYENFYEKEIEDRKQYGYPPFCHLAQVECTDKDEQNLYITIEKICNELKDADVDVLGYEKSKVFMINKVFNIVLWIKIKNNQNIIKNVLQKYNVKIFII